MSKSNYVIRVHEDPGAIARDAWNALLARQPLPTPFMRHEYLCALHDSGSAVAPLRGAKAGRGARAWWARG